MIISDLSHFEVVAEATSILGGSSQPSRQLASNLLNDFSDQLSSPVQTNSLFTTGNQAVSATAGTFTTQIAGEPVEGVISVSLANS